MNVGERCIDDFASMTISYIRDKLNVIGQNIIHRLLSYEPDQIPDFVSKIAIARQRYKWPQWSKLEKAKGWQGARTLGGGRKQIRTVRTRWRPKETEEDRRRADGRNTKSALLRTLTV